jgi:hypothetical protein
MLTPSEYKARYENIYVSSKTGGGVTVQVNQYRLYGSNDSKSAAKAFTDTLKYRGIDTPLLINTGERMDIVDSQSSGKDDLIRSHGWDSTDLTLSGGGLQALRLRRRDPHRPARPLGTFYTGGPYLLPPWRGHWDKTLNNYTNNWTKLAHLVFAGKGSPEACQAVLLLANHWGLAPDVQTYADVVLGLDCNGFVGNYLWHAQKGNPWMDLGAENHDLGPDSPIRSGYFDHYSSHLLDRWESLDSGKMYILMEVGTDGQVINGGGSADDAGHLAITQPGQRQDRAGKGGKMSFAVRVVESTASHSPGLWESWYTCVSYDSSTKIFVIDREDMVPARRQIKFMIASVS